MVKKKISKKVIEKVESYLNFLTNKGLKIKAAYLFGSYAIGNIHKGSDIDVCIVSDEFKSWSESISKLNKQKRYIEEFIDIEGHGFSVSDFNNKFLSLPVEIKRTGIRIL